MRGAFVVAVALAAALAPQKARADAVSPRPLECPPGSVHDVSHRGDTCVATKCETESDCARLDMPWGKHEWTCELAALCVEHMVGDTSWHGPSTHDVARRACNSEENCVRPETCEAAKRCVDHARSNEPKDEPTAAEDEPARRGCSCRATSTSADAPWLPLLAVLAFGARRARRPTT